MAADPSCSPPATGNWNITNTSVLCDNGTAITVNGSVIIDNATLSVTNGTLLNASSIKLYNTTANSTLRFNESSGTNASIILFGHAALYFHNGTLDNNLILNDSWAFADFDHAAVTGSILFSSNNGGSAFVNLENSAYDFDFINVQTGILNVTNATIVLSGAQGLLLGASASYTATAYFTDAVVNASSFALNPNSTLTASRFTANTTLALYENTTATLANVTAPLIASNGTLNADTDARSWLIADLVLNSSANASLRDLNGTVSAEDSTLAITGFLNGALSALYSNVTATGVSSSLFSLTGGFLFASSSTLNLSATNSNITLSSVNATTLVAAGGSASLADVNVTTATLSGNSTFTNLLAINITFAGAGISSGSANITGVLFLNDNHSLTLNDSAVAVLASNGSGGGFSILRGNFTVASIGVISQNLTRFMPLFLQNETGASLVGSSLHLYGLNETRRRGTSWSAEDIDFLWDDANPTSLTLYNSTWNDTVVLSGSGSIYNYTGYSLLGEVYNFTINTSTNILRIIRYSDAALWNVPLIRSDYFLLWSGVTGANGFIDVNVSGTNITYADLFVLNTHHQNTSITLANDTPMTWRVDADAPALSINGTNIPIYAGLFNWNVTVQNDTANMNYTISNGSVIWTNGSVSGAVLNSSGWFFNRSYDGLFLPAGTWMLNVTVRDQYYNARSSALSFTSESAIRASLLSSASQEATIGGSSIGFTFNVTTKGAGSVVKAFLNLTNGALTFNSAYAKLMGSSSNASVSGSGSYVGAGNLSLLPISSWPSYVALNLSQAGVYNDALTLSLTPYEGLSAGTYSGSYGFGVFG